MAHCTSGHQCCPWNSLLDRNPQHNPVRRTSYGWRPRNHTRPDTQIQQFRADRPRCKLLGIHSDPYSYLLFHPVDRQYFIPTCHLLDEHQVHTFGNIHRPAHCRTYRWSASHDCSDSLLHRHQSHSFQILQTYKGYTKTHTF